MLIKLDRWMNSVLLDSEEYIGKTPTIKLGEDEYVDIEELIGTIENLNDEIQRQIEKVEQYDKDIQENYVPKRRISREYGE
jgi:small nuclear ribonucleoprotein (snRNP)-like protein